MSNFVYGFIETNIEVHLAKAAIEQVAARQPLGFREIPIEELYGFPKELLPQDLIRVVIFEISDGKEKWGAEYLIDGIDYAFEAKIGLPNAARERQHLLIRLLEAITSLDVVKTIFVAMNQCNQIKEFKTTSFSNFGRVILSDFEIDAPPDNLYIIRKT